RSRPDELGDATRRTRLANERTYLAWWRSGLTAFAVSIGAGKLAPELAGGTRWPYVILGIGYAILGVAFIAYGSVRRSAVERAVARGEYEQPSPWIIGALTAFGALLGVLTLSLIVYGG